MVVGRRWMQSEDCHRLCQVLAALKTRPHGRTMAQVVGKFVAQYLQPPQLIAVGAWDGQLHVITAEPLQKVDSIQLGKAVNRLEQWPSSNNVLSCVEWAPAGDVFAVAGSDGLLRLLMVDPLQVLREKKLKQIRRMSSLKWAPDGSRIAVAGSGKVFCFDSKSLALLAQVDFGKNQLLQVVNPRSVTWSPDGKHLVAACDDGCIKVIEVQPQSLAVRKSLRLDSDRHSCVNSVSWAPSGECLTVCYGNPPKLGILKTDDFSVQCSLGFHGAVRSHAWSPDGKRLAAGSYDAYVRLYKVETLELLNEVRLYVTESTVADAVKALTWATRGEQLVAAAGKRVHLLSANGLVVLQVVHMPDTVYSLSWMPQSSLEQE